MHSQMFTETLAQSEELIHGIAARLSSRIGGQLRDFRITIQEDGLVLPGRVSTYYGKQMAQVVARELSGLAIVANEIEVI